MTLDEAIRHADEVAGRCTGECSAEHHQLAEWLKELKDYHGSDKGWERMKRHNSIRKINSYSSETETSYTAVEKCGELITATSRFLGKAPGSLENLVSGIAGIRLICDRLILMLKIEQDVQREYLRQLQQSERNIDNPPFKQEEFSPVINWFNCTDIQAGRDFQYSLCEFRQNSGDKPEQGLLCGALYNGTDPKAFLCAHYDGTLSRYAEFRPLLSFYYSRSNCAGLAPGEHKAYLFDNLEGRLVRGVCVKVTGTKEPFIASVDGMLPGCTDSFKYCLPVDEIYKSAPEKYAGWYTPAGADSLARTRALHGKECEFCATFSDAMTSTCIHRGKLSDIVLGSTEPPYRCETPDGNYIRFAFLREITPLKEI